MSMTLIHPNDRERLEREGCHEHVRQAAQDTKRQVLKLAWDEPGTPEHCFGYVQWSTRPYRVTDGCDGTRDSSALLVALTFCERTGLDLAALNEAAYPDEENWFRHPEYLAHLEKHREMTEIPEVNEANINALLASLYDMNHRSLVMELTEAWSAQGYAVD